MPLTIQRCCSTSLAPVRTMTAVPGHIGLITLDYPFGYRTIRSTSIRRSSEQPSELCTTVVPIPYLYPAQEVATTTEEANKCTIGMAESLLFRDAKEPKK